MTTEANNEDTPRPAEFLSDDDLTDELLRRNDQALIVLRKNGLPSEGRYKQPQSAVFVGFQGGPENAIFLATHAIHFLWGQWVQGFGPPKLSPPPFEGDEDQPFET